jgi:hypothetical protein
VTDAVALKVTPAAEATEVLKLQHSCRIRLNNHGIKINQVGIVSTGPLARIDAMCIVAG